MSHAHIWLFGVMVMTCDWESVGCEFEYKKEKSSLISLILNSKWENSYAYNCQPTVSYAE